MKREYKCGCGIVDSLEHLNCYLGIDHDGSICRKCNQPILFRETGINEFTITREKVNEILKYIPKQHKLAISLENLIKDRWRGVLGYENIIDDGIWPE